MARPTTPAVPQSPPKRVTRARARGAAAAKPEDPVDTVPEAKAKSRSKAATTSTAAKTAAKSKKTEKTKTGSTEIIESRTTRTARKGAVKSEVEDEDVSDEEDELDVVRSVNVKPKASTTRSRGTAAPSRIGARGMRGAPAAAEEDEDNDDDDELAKINSPKKRTTRTRAAPPAKTDVDVPKAAAPKRGRPAKATAAANGKETETETAKAPKATRQRATRSVVTAGSTAAARAKTATEAPKKVTFQDLPPESDKENQPLQGRKKKTLVDVPASGLKAKPVRGGAASGRGKKAEKKDVQPLSPKKATQVARTGSSAGSGDDEDELSGAKTEMHVIHRSPVKGSTLNRSMGSPVKKIDFGVSKTEQDDTATVESANEIVQGLMSISNPPAASSESVIMGSPARKLPPSPYKDAMRQSPKRGGIVIEDNAGSNQQQLALRPHSSPLKSSPKKGNLGASFTSPAKTPGTPFNAKVSLLKSPAKKIPSPFKPVADPTKIGNIEEARDSKHNEKTEMDAEDNPAEFIIQEDADGDGDVFDDDQAEVDFEKSVLDIGNPLNAPNENAHEQLQYVDVVEDGDGDELDGMCEVQKENSCPLTVTETFSEPSSPAARYDVSESEEVLDPTHNLRNIPPAAPSPPAQATINPAAFEYRWEIDDEGSDDELMPGNSPVRRRSIFQRTETPRRKTPQSADNGEDDPFQSQENHKSEPEKNIGFTPLAAQLSNWNPTTPAEQRPTRSRGRGIFSPIIPATKKKTKSLAPRNSGAAPGQTFFEDEMAIRENEEQGVEEGEKGQYEVDDNESQPNVEVFDHGDSTSDFHNESDEEVNGDENAAPPAETTIPIDPKFFEGAEDEIDFEDDKENKIQPKPTMSLTPVRRERTPRTIHTVSKVPLKAEGEVSPIKVPKKRSRSLTNHASNNPAPKLSKSPSDGSLPQKANTPRRGGYKDEDQSLSKNGSWSTAGSPVKTPRKSLSVENQVLSGAVVYTDVHTTDGADASGIFVELLSQMGARCVKNWTWSPRMSLSPVDGVDPNQAKIGITHVVFKDGGIKTLEKVKETNGVVKCVGVGWVLDCERENRWLDESEYAVDLSFVPRGGQKRRKSMEPRALSNVNGTLVKIDSSTPSASSRRAAAEWGTMEEFIRLSPTPPGSPRGSRESTPEGSTKNQGDATTPRQSKQRQTSSEVPETPVNTDYNFDFSVPDTISQSPTTPYYLSQGAKLVQQTCPPKQLREGLFPVSGQIEDQPDQNLRIRLEAARRKSLVWKPKVGSPLAR